MTALSTMEVEVGMLFIGLLSELANSQVVARKYTCRYESLSITVHQDCRAEHITTFLVKSAH